MPVGRSALQPCMYLLDLDCCTLPFSGRLFNNRLIFTIPNTLGIWHSSCDYQSVFRFFSEKSAVEVANLQRDTVSGLCCTGTAVAPGIDCWFRLLPLSDFTV